MDFLGIKDSITLFFRTVDPFFLWYYSAVNLVYTIMLFFGVFKIFKRKNEISVEDFTKIYQSNVLPQITFIITIYNNGTKALKLTENILHLSYRYKNLILVNDGSSDNSLKLLLEAYDFIKIPKFYEDKIGTKPVIGMYRSRKMPEIMLIDKERGRKFDALNAAINAAVDPLCIEVDSDTLIDNSNFEALIRPLLFDPELIAVGTSVRLSNGCSLKYNKISTEKFPENRLAGFQALEYLRAFWERQGWDIVGRNVVISGAFTVFKTDIIRSLGGYLGSVAEDMELVIRLNRVIIKWHLPFRVMHIPDPVAWTEGPSTNKALGVQRSLWHMGLMESLYLHKGLILNPRYGIFGLFTLPFWIWGETVEPVVEMLGYLFILLGYLFGAITGYFVLLMLLVGWGFTVIFSFICILIEEFSFRKYSSLRSLLYLFWYAITENLGYRQKTIFWRLRGIIWFFKNFDGVRKMSGQLKILLSTFKKGTFL